MPVMIMGTVLGVFYTLLTLSDSLSLFNSITNIPFVYFVIVLFGLSYMALFLQNRKQAQTVPGKLKLNFKLNHLEELFLIGNSKNNGIVVNATLSVILALLVISMWWVFKI